jgi:hypothetical protein
MANSGDASSSSPAHCFVNGNCPASIAVIAAVCVVALLIVAIVIRKRNQGGAAARRVGSLDEVMMRSGEQSGYRGDVNNNINNLFQKSNASRRNSHQFQNNTNFLPENQYRAFHVEEFKDEELASIFRFARSWMKKW